jgi:hypothetical protein
MISITRAKWLNMLRVTIVLQSLVTVWFFVAPDTIPQVFREAEQANDRPLYETLDSFIVPIFHLQAFLCVMLWWPVRATAIGYLLCVVAVLALGSFAGPGLLSAIDGTFSGIQGYASGAMIMLLYQGGFFQLSKIRTNGKIVIS